jgi:hypothetical protein
LSANVVAVTVLQIANHMPARTNQFQKLIFEIERQLAPLGAVVKESAMLPERLTGELREVDILVSIDEGHHRVQIGIECQDRSRPATKQWVEAIAKKHEDLGINKTVLISSSGFYSAARRRAESLFIGVLDIKGINKADWPAEVFRNLKVPVRDRRSELIKIFWGSFEQVPGQTQKAVSKWKGLTARLADGSSIALLDVVHKYGNGILEQLAMNDEPPADAVVRLYEDLHFYKGPTLVGVATHLFLRWKHKTHFFVIRLKPFRYGNRVLAVGYAKRRGMKWTASAIVESPGVVRIKCEAPGALKSAFKFAKFPKAQQHLLA